MKPRDEFELHSVRAQRQAGTGDIRSTLLSIVILCAFDCVQRPGDESFAALPRAGVVLHTTAGELVHSSLESVSGTYLAAWE